jgi:Abnormal spindle-like microcephaly-assoc'd, ASPM-SPD-2-Hydin
MQFDPSPRISALVGIVLALLFAGTADAQQNSGPSGRAAASSRLSCKPAVLQFGRIRVKQIGDLPVILTNTGTTSIRISEIRRSSAVFGVANQALPFTLAPGHSRKLRISFRPSISGEVSGNLAFVSNAVDPTLNLSVHGIGVTGSLISTPSRISFGSVRTHSGKAEYETLKNFSSTEVMISAVTVSGSEFSTRGLNLPLELRTGESYTFKAVFRPKSPGRKIGSLTVVSNAADRTLTIPLLGSSLPAGRLRLGAGTLDFGMVRVGASKSLSGVLSASEAAVTVTSASSNSPEFRLSGVSFPIHLEPGQRARFTVKFAPESSGLASGNISFHSNAADSSLSAALMGNGTAAQHRVTLEWNASAPRVTGYYIYRSEVPGRKYFRLNSLLNPDTAFTDWFVQSGKTYYYVTTAVSEDGIESAYSNRVEVAIP